MSRTIASLAQRRFTVEEYHRMAERGILGPEERVELVRGLIREMSPKNRAHVVATKRVYRRLDEALRGRASVYQEAPLVAEAIDSEPEPDVLVCSNPDDSAYGTPRTVPVLVIEVADSSLAYDLDEKTRLYAEAGVPEYWVVDLVDRELVVFRSAREGLYRERVAYRPGDRVAPQPWPDVAIEVAEVFPTEEPPSQASDGRRPPGCR